MNTGIYSLADAARIVRIRPERLRAWVRGRPNWSGKATDSYGPVFSTSGDSLTFADLLELRVVRGLLEHGATLARIRRAHSRLGSLLNTPYPFIDAEGIRVLGRDIVAPIEYEILNLANDQFLFGFVSDYLKDVRFEGRSPVSVKPDGEDSAVVIDARIRFGEPTVEGTRVPTADVYDLWIAEGKDANAVARAYGLTIHQVRSAVAYEEARRAPWAA